jgi:hypothetical protein
LQLKDAIANVTNVSAYDTYLHDNHFLFVELKYQNAWEVHFSNVTQDNSFDISNVLTNPAGMMQLLSTAAMFYEKRLLKGNAIRYYTHSPRLKTLYDATFDIIVKRKLPGATLVKKEQSPFTGPDGVVHSSATMARLDPHTLNLEPLGPGISPAQ